MAQHAFDFEWQIDFIACYRVDAFKTGFWSFGHKKNVKRACTLKIIIILDIINFNYFRVPMANNNRENWFKIVSSKGLYYSKVVK